MHRIYIYIYICGLCRTFCLCLGTPMSSAKPAELIWSRCCLGLKKPCVGWGAHWCHLANTIKQSVHCGDAAVCKITLTTCLDIESERPLPATCRPGRRDFPPLLHRSRRHSCTVTRIAIKLKDVAFPVEQLSSYWKTNRDSTQCTDCTVCLKITTLQTCVGNTRHRM